MIIKNVRGKIFDTEAEHIAFPINVEGFSDSKTAFTIVENYWPELYHTGKHSLGDVISKKVDGKTFHALVCHSAFKGWGEEQKSIITDCFNKIESDGKPVAAELIGTGIIAMIQGSDSQAILQGIAASKTLVELHSDLAPEEISACLRRKPKIYENIL